MTDLRARDPLPDAHFERLQALLESSGPGKAMNIERLDGFLAALIAGPDMVMPSEYLPLVFGVENLDESGLATEEEPKRNAAYGRDGI